MKRYTENDSLWVRLQKESRPIFLYGTGNGADKILDVCERFNIPIEGVFASSDFVRSRTFRGFPVQSLSAIEEKYGDDIVVLLAFGTTLLSVAENIKAVAEKHTLYIPEVPLYGTELFTYDYYLENLEKIEAAEAAFADERSRAVYSDMIEFRLSGRPRLLANAEPVAESYKEIFSDLSFETAVDCGAYKGDSTEMMAEVISPAEIIAAEPDPKTFLKLSAYAEREERTRVTPVNCAVGNECSTISFMSHGGRGSAAEGLSKSAKCIDVPLLTVESIAAGKKVDLIKLDVEGNELSAIEGALGIIREQKPNMAVSVYHRTEDIFSLPLLLKSLLPDHSFFLRREACIPAWDITLFAKRN